MVHSTDSGIGTAPCLLMFVVRIVGDCERHCLRIVWLLVKWNDYVLWRRF